MRTVKIIVPDDFDPETHKVYCKPPLPQDADYPNFPAEERVPLEIWSPVYRNCLDKGHIGLVDFMGSDETIVNAARVSYGRGTRRISEDRNLIRYLIRNRHWTPVEMVEVMWHVRAPIFVFRQWHRHRAACLAGDVKLSFDLPGGIERKGHASYSLTVKDIFDRFQPSVRAKRPERQVNAHFKRSRVQGMMLRSCDEDLLTPYHTQIANIWESGIKPIIRVEFENGKTLRATADHRCFTNLGWMRLEDALQSNAHFAATGREFGYTSFDPVLTDDQLLNEKWAIIPFNDNYEVSTFGRVRTLKTLKIKTATPTPQGYRVVSLSRNGISRAYLVHNLVLVAFEKHRNADEQTRHIDNNRANNCLDNLDVGTVIENANDRMTTGTKQKLSVVFVQSVEHYQDGEEMTYDLEVTGPYHNFCAGGVFVHNSINEYSARYSILTDDMYMPDAEVMMHQSTSNKQGREGLLSEKNAMACQLQLKSVYDQCAQSYRYLLGLTPTPDGHLENRFQLIREFALKQIQWLTKTNEDWAPDKVTEEMIDGKTREIFEAQGLYYTDEEFWGETGAGLSRELSRIGMPLATYSEMYWKADLRNTFNFLSLRYDEHAQEEIRVYAKAMLEMLEPIAPIAVAAFSEYVMQGKQFSHTELEVVRQLYKRYGHMNLKEGDNFVNELMTDLGASKRETREFIKTLEG